MPFSIPFFYTVSDPIVAPPPPVGGALRLDLAFVDGRTLSCDQSMAEDIGTIDDGPVHQRCLRWRATGNGDYRDGFVIRFEPEADGSRQQIVIEYGTEFDFSVHPVVPARGVKPVHCGAYTATISGGGLAAPVPVKVPCHPWMQRWRWQSAPRPVVRGYAELLAMKAILPLDSKMLFNAPPPDAITWGGPMTLGGIPTGMGIAGDRPAIGFINDHMAYWLLTGSGESSWRAMAEATGTMPAWARDVATGALLDVHAHPYLALVADGFHGPNLIPKPAAAAPAANSITMDAAHMTPASMTAYLATHDPYYLEGAQMCANYAPLEANVATYANKLPGTIQSISTRVYAWGARDQMMLAAFCPDTLPAWMLPRTYWKACLEDSRTTGMKYVNAKVSLATTLFGAFPLTSVVGAFQNGYGAIWAGWGKWSGLFPEWEPVFEYASRVTRKMADPNSGWDRRFQVPYVVPVAYARRGALGFVRGVTAESGPNVPASPDTPTTWKELWDCFCTYARDSTQFPQPNWVDPATLPADKLFPYQTIYLPEIRAGLATLALAGYADAQANYPWLEQHMRSDFPVRPVGNYKWAVPAA